MAEQDKKIYISAREFINSWEKEIYQLTNLDLFAYQLINELASTIEGIYFRGKTSPQDALFLYTEEIGSLCFNMADSMQLFFEKNCFGACKLNCPVELNKKAAKDEWSPPAGLIQMNIIPSSFYSKEQCLHFDMLNYVIMDSLIDYYNYELGTVLDEDDERLIRFAEFIVKVVLEFIKSKGQLHLSRPGENASDSFNDLLLNDHGDWQDILPEKTLEDEEAPEPWKLSEAGLERVVGEFYESCKGNEISDKQLNIIKKLKEYFVNFLELDYVDEITLEDFGEFLTAVFPGEMIFASDSDLEDAHHIIKMFAEHLEYAHHSDIARRFLELDRLVFADVTRAIKVVQHYSQNHSYIHHLLNSADDENTSAEGFMRINEEHADSYELEDIHLKSKFEHVDLSALDIDNLHKGDILHLQLSYDGETWTLIHLEMVYCAYARHYLF